MRRSPCSGRRAVHRRRDLGVTGPVRFGSTSPFEVDIGPATRATRQRDRTSRSHPARGSCSSRIRPRSSAHDRDRAASRRRRAEQFTLAHRLRVLRRGPRSSTPTSSPSRSPTAQSFSSFALTPNQRPSPSPRCRGRRRHRRSPDVFDASACHRERATPLLDAIGGESLTAFATARQILAERTARALHRRTRDPAWGEGARSTSPKTPSRGRETNDR